MSEIVGRLLACWNVGYNGDISFNLDQRQIFYYKFGWGCGMFRCTDNKRDKKLNESSFLELYTLKQSTIWAQSYWKNRSLFTIKRAISSERESVLPCQGDLKDLVSSDEWSESRQALFSWTSDTHQQGVTTRGANDTWNLNKVYHSILKKIMRILSENWTLRVLAALPGTPNKQNLPNKRKHHQKSLNFTLKDILSYAGTVRVFFSQTASYFTQHI